MIPSWNGQFFLTVSQLFSKQALSSWFGCSNHQPFLNIYFLLIYNHDLQVANVSTGLYSQRVANSRKKNNARQVSATVRNKYAEIAASRKSKQFRCLVLSNTIYLKHRLGTMPVSAWLYRASAYTPITNYIDTSNHITVHCWLKWLFVVWYFLEISVKILLSSAKFENNVCESSMSCCLTRQLLNYGKFLYFKLYI